MALHTQESVSGFIASDPQLTYTERGDARFYAKIGQEHYRKEPDGSFTQTETTFHDLVAFKKTAERAHDRLAKGDKFVAEGYTREYDRATPEGEVVNLPQRNSEPKIGRNEPCPCGSGKKYKHCHGQIS